MGTMLFLMLELLVITRCGARIVDYRKQADDDDALRTAKKAPMKQEQASEIEVPLKPKSIPEKQPQKERKLTGMMAYGIYRSRPYYTPLERRFRSQNGYDDGYLIKIFEDDDYVILTMFVEVNNPRAFEISPPPGSNVIIVNLRDFIGGESYVHIANLDKLRARAYQRWWDKESVKYFIDQVENFQDYPTKKLKGY